MSRTPARRPLRTTPEADRYASLARILRLVRILEVTQGLSTRELLERQGITRRTWERYRAAIDAAGLPLVAETSGREKVWRIQPGLHRSALRIHQAHAVALLVQQRGTTFLRGTGFDDLLEEVFQQAEAMLGTRDRARVQHLDRKIFDRNDDALVHDGRAEDVSELVSALLYEERLEVRYKGRPEPFTVDPYTLVIYRKGLYLVGFSHRHAAVRRFALDRFDAIDRKRGERFAYPADYDPARLFAGTFGIAGDHEPVRVRIRFWGAQTIEAVSRRRVHPSQAWETRGARADGCRVLTIDVADDDRDLERWILGFGGEAEVLEPRALRDRIAERAALIARRHAVRATPPRRS